MQEFRGAFRQADEAGTVFLASIENDAPRLAEGADLPGIDKFEVFEDWDKNEWFALANIYDGQVNALDGDTLPERFDVLQIGVKGGCVDVGPGRSRDVHSAHYWRLLTFPKSLSTPMTPFTLSSRTNRRCN